MFTRTMRHFYARWSEGRLPWNYGVNTGKSRAIALELSGGITLEDVPYHVLPRAAFPTPAAGRGWSAERVRRFDERFDRLYDAVRWPYRLLARRDARYLDWRYGRVPDGDHQTYALTRRGRLVGWGVFRRRGEHLLWGDALVDAREPEAARRLLAHALAAPENAGVSAVAMWAAARPAWWRTRLLELGFAPRPEPDDLSFVVAPFELSDVNVLRRDLYYTMGDSDLF